MQFSLGFTPNTVPNSQQAQLQAQYYLQNAFPGQSFAPTPTATPDYAKIYRFLAGLFDPKEANHQAKLNEMRQVDRETAQILMHNLAINLTNRTFTESHKTLIEQRKNLESSRSPTKQSNSKEPVNAPKREKSTTTVEASEQDNKYSDTCFLINK